MKGSLLAVSVAAGALWAFGGDEVIDGKYYWRDGAGVLHQYYFYNAFSGTSWGGRFRSTPEVQDPAETFLWDSSKIMVLEANTSYGSEENLEVSPRTYFGIRVDTTPFTFNGSGALHFGAYGIRASIDNANLKFLRRGPYWLDASQTWSGPTNVSELTATPFVIAPDATTSGAGYAYGEINSAENVTWTIAGNLILALYTPTNHLESCDVVVKKPAILSLVSHYRNSKEGYPAMLNARKLTLDGGTGIYFGKQTKIGGSDYALQTGTSYKGIGSTPTINPLLVAPVIELKGDAALTATEKTTVSGGVTIVAAAGTSSCLIGEFSFADDETVLVAEDGATLDLTGATVSGSGRITLRGSGTFKIDSNAEGAAERFFVAADSTATFDVHSGFLIVRKGAGKTVNTYDSGRVFIVDPTGFVSLGGTRNVETAGEGSLYVGETARENEKLAVGDGQTLKVYGSGLKQSSSLVLSAGAKVMFYGTALIGASVTSSGTVEFGTVDPSVTGTLAGTYVSASSASAEIKISSPGCVVFAGGGQIGAYDMFSLYSGNAAVTGVYDSKGAIKILGGHLTVRDGGKWSISQAWKNCYLHLNTAADACLEIGAGGEFEMKAGDCYVYLGSETVHESKLLVNGGTFKHNADQFHLKKGGVLEVAAGTFSTARKITCDAGATKDNAKVILGNGTFVCRGGSGQKVLFDGDGSCGVLIAGQASLQSTATTAFPPDSDTANCTWTCAEGAALHVVGRTDAVDRLVLHEFEADGLTFDLNETDVQVELVDVAGPISLGWLLPGGASSKVIASGTAPVLTANYIVPGAAEFNAAEVPSAWYEGFSSVSVGDVRLEQGATLALPCFGPARPVALPGKLTLPAVANYRIVRQGASTHLDDAIVLTATGGIEGSPVWTCVGGVVKDRASLRVNGNGLEFSYDPPGMVVTIR